MKRTRANIIVALSIFLLGACKKNDADPVPISPRLKTVTSNGNTNTFEYDQQGRISKAIYNNGGYDMYTYTSGRVTLKYYNASGMFVAEGAYDLDAGGLAIKEYDQNVLEDQYEYDAANRLTREYRTASNGDLTEGRYYYSGTGLLDSVVYKRTSSTGSLLYHQKSAYLYSGNKPNTIAHENYGKAFRGKASGQLYDKERYTNPLAGIDFEINYTYEYDASGRVTKNTTVYPSTTNVSTYTYY